METTGSPYNFSSYSISSSSSSSSPGINGHWGQIPVMSFLLVFGVMANLSIVIIVLKNSRMRTTQNMIVVNLTVGDLLCLLLNLPFRIYTHTKIHQTGRADWIFGEFMCKLVNSTWVTSGCITVYSLMALAIERYLAIVWPLRNRENNRCVRVSRSCFLNPTWQIILLIWIGSHIAGAPVWHLSYTAVNNFYNTTDCTETDHGGDTALTYKVFLLLSAYAVPLFVIVVLHSLTAVALCTSVRERMATDSVCHANRQTSRVRSRLKLAVVITVLSVMFFIAWLPVYIFDFLRQYPLENYHIISHPVHMKLYWWRNIPIYTLCCVNPVMLYVLSTRFREQLFCSGRQQQWTAEHFSSLKSSFLSTSTFRGRSTGTRRLTSKTDSRGSHPTHEMVKL